MTAQDLGDGHPDPCDTTTSEEVGGHVTTGGPATPAHNPCVRGDNVPSGWASLACAGAF